MLKQNHERSNYIQGDRTCAVCNEANDKCNNCCAINIPTGFFGKGFATAAMRELVCQSGFEWAGSQSLELCRPVWYKLLDRAVLARLP